MCNSIYKYTRSENWNYFFKNWSIRFTPPDELNDPYDCKPAVYNDSARTSEEGYFDIATIPKILNEARQIYRNGFCPPMTEDQFIVIALEKYVAYLNQISSDKHLSTEHICNVINYFRENYGVLSLTVKQNNIPMWSHYAENHKGFVVALNKQSHMLDGILDSVQYTNERNKASFQDIINGKLNNYVKSAYWSYEEEVRAIASFSNPNQIEWIEGKIKGVARLRKKDVLSVTFGAAMDEKEIQRKCEYIRAQDGCAHIQLNRATLHPDKYELVIEPC